VSEADRIRGEYLRRAHEISADTYSVVKPVNLFFIQQRVRRCLSFLNQCNFGRFDDKRILEVGCGEGGWLVDFASWGVPHSNLAGIDLMEARLDLARNRLGDMRDLY